MAEQLGLQQVEVADEQGRTLTGVGVPEESLQEVIDARAEPADETPADGSGEPPPSSPPADATPPAARADGRDTQTGQFTKRLRGQERYTKITSERDQARQEAQALKERAERADALEKENARLKAEFEAAKAPRTPESAAVPPLVPSAAAAAPASGVPPKPRTDEIGTKYADYEAYLDARDEWNARFGPLVSSVVPQQIEQLWQQREQQRQIESRSRELATNWDTAQQRGRQKYADFDQRIGPLLNVTLEGPILDTLAAHPQAEEIAYRLMSDPTLVQAFAGPQAHPLQQAMILGQLLASAPGTVAPASAPRVQSSTAPPPYQPVGSRAKTTSPTLEELAAAGDYDGYRREKRRLQG